MFQCAASANGLCHALSNVKIFYYCLCVWWWWWEGGQLLDISCSYSCSGGPHAPPPLTLAIRLWAKANDFGSRHRLLLLLLFILVLFFQMVPCTNSETRPIQCLPWQSGLRRTVWNVYGEYQPATYQQCMCSCSLLASLVKQNKLHVNGQPTRCYELQERESH
jgi:hypothetical protein